MALPAEAVLDAGDRMARLLATSNTIPTDLDIAVDQVLVRATAGQCFLLFCDFLASAYSSGTYPEYTPLERFPISAAAQGQGEPAEPLAAPPQAADKPLAVQTSRLIAQCTAAADMVRRTHSLPGGIWVQGHRLSAAQFLAATATILQQLRYFGVAPDLVAVHRVAPPARWLEAVTIAGAAFQGAAPQPGPEARTEAPAAPPAPAAPAPAPEIRIIPSEDRTVEGLTPVTAIYHGPQGFLRILIDGRTVAVSNVSPFTYVWDTRVDAEGRHAVAVEAVSGGEIVAQAAVTLSAQNGGPAL